MKTIFKISLAKKQKLNLENTEKKVIVKWGKTKNKKNYNEINDQMT